MPNIFDFFFDLLTMLFTFVEKLYPILTTNIWDLYLQLNNSWRITIQILSVGLINILKFFNFNLINLSFVSIGILLIFKFIKKFVPTS